jgi:hypothetical protein
MYIIEVKVNLSKETFPTPIRTAYSYWPLKPVFLPTLLTTAANDQFSSSFAIALPV